MARPSAFNVHIDVKQITGLADKLGAMTPEAVGGLMVDAINNTADSAYELSRKAILQGINLTDSYVQSHMHVEHATAKRPKAEIVAYGGKGHTTSLSHYGPMQLTQRVMHPKRSKGDANRGIPAGSKSAGLSIEVTSGSRKPIAHGFTMPGKLDSEKNMLVFTRDRNNKVKSRQGPSVYQLFRVAGAEIENQVYGDLERAVVDAAEQQFLKELS